MTKDEWLKDCPDCDGGRLMAMVKTCVWCHGIYTPGASDAN